MKHKKSPSIQKASSVLSWITGNLQSQLITKNSGMTLSSYYNGYHCAKRMDSILCEQEPSLQVVLQKVLGGDKGCGQLE